MNHKVIQFMERSENSWQSQFMTIVNSLIDIISHSQSEYIFALAK